MLEENSSLEIIFLDNVDDGIKCLIKSKHFIVMRTIEPLSIWGSKKGNSIPFGQGASCLNVC